VVSVESVNRMPIVRIEDRREDLLAAIYATRKILRKKVQLTIGIDNDNLVKHQYRKSGIDLFRQKTDTSRRFVAVTLVKIIA